MEEFITACPRNCYSTCSFIVQTEHNTVRRILPYSGNLATPEGPCIKGLSYIERSVSKDRIIYPLKRSATGKFERITMEEALGLVASRLAGIREESGPHSILWYRGSGMSGLVNETATAFWKAFGGATTTYGNLCWPAGLEAVRLTLGEVKHNVPWDLENAGTIIIWGKNPAETNIQELAFIAKAREKGAVIIVIDPLRTPTADKADLLICPRPGTDGALALAVAKVLIGEDLVDHEFISKNVHGFEEYKNSLRLTPSDAEEICGIPAGDIEDLARTIAKNGPLTIIPGYGLQRHRNGGQTIRAILSLSILTGNIGKTGAGFNYANLQSYIFDSVKEPLSYYPDPEKDAPFRRTLPMTALGTAMLSLVNPPLHAAWIERGNPILQSPDSFNVRKAFEKLGFIVVSEEFMTDTAAMADIILPSKNLFEQSDILGSYWSPYVSFKPKILEPPGEVVPESEVYYRLAKKLSLEIPEDELPAPGNENTELWLEKRIRGYSGLTLADLKKGPVLAPGLQSIAYSDLVFPTVSGKIELWSDEASARWGTAPLPDFRTGEQDEQVEKYPVHFLTPNSGTRIHSQFGNLEIIRAAAGEPAALVSAADAGKRKILDADTIRIFNQYGWIKTKAKISNRVPPGIIVLHNGIWLGEGGGGNALVSGCFTDMGFGAAFHDTMVEFEKASDEN